MKAKHETTTATLIISFFILSKLVYRLAIIIASPFLVTPHFTTFAVCVHAHKLVTAVRMTGAAPFLFHAFTITKIIDGGFTRHYIFHLRPAEFARHIGEAHFKLFHCVCFKWFLKIIVLPRYF